MKKAADGVHWEVPKTLLHREDLEELIAIISRHSSRVEILVGGYELEDASEISQLPMAMTSELSLKSRQPYVSLDIQPSNGRLYSAADDGALGRGIADEMRQVLLRSRDWWRQAASLAYVVAPAALLFLAIAAGISFAHGRTRTGAALAIGGLGAAAWGWWGWRESMERRVRIMLHTSGERPGFFVRNADEIVIALASLVVGGLLTKLLGL